MEQRDSLSKAEQVKKIAQLEALHGKPTVGDKWYAVNAKWWQQFSQTESTSTSLGKIDNRSLYNEALERLKETAQEDVDFVLKHELVWKQLRNWYRGSPEICGFVVKGKNGAPIIDMFPAKFELQLESHGNSTMFGESDERAEPNMSLGVKKHPEQFAASRYLKMSELKTEVAKYLKKKPENIKLMFKPPESEAPADTSFEALDETDETLMDQPLDDALPRCGLVLYSLKVVIAEVPAEAPRDEDGNAGNSLTPLSELPAPRLAAFKKFNLENPEAGQRLDAKKGDTWFEAIVTEVFTDKSNIKRLKVHFLSFDPKEDETFALTSEDIQAPYSKVSDWRTQLRVGQSIELNKRFYSGSSGWIEAEVVKIDRNGTKLKRSSSIAEKSTDEEENTTVLGKIVTNVTNGLKKMLPSSRKSSDRYFSYSTRSNSANQTGLAQQQVQQNGMFKPPSVKTMNFRNKHKTEGNGKSEKLATEQVDSEKDLSENITSDTLDQRQKDGNKKLPPVSEHGLVLLRVNSSSYPGYSTYTYSSIYMSSQRMGKEVVVDLGSEFIASEHTHIKKETSKHMFSFNRNLESKPEIHGIVGLRNLGNTCYMNSSLQCLFQATALTNYFLGGEYKKDINRRNPLGFGGKMASQYGKLIEQVFSDKFSTVSPTDFKNMISTCLQNFQGYGQQDAHEFVSLLIDGLHEDLNRVKVKPYFEDKEDEAKKKTEAQLANEEWDNFLARNDSVFVNHMYGQLKSHLVCPDCGNEATKFDAYSTLLVPIPVQEVNFLKIVVVLLAPRKVKVESFGKNQKQKHTLIPLLEADTVALTERKHVEIKDKDTEDQGEEKEEAVKEEESDAVKTEILETRYIRLVYQQEGTNISPTAVADFICSSLELNLEDLVITDLKLNKPENIVYDPDNKEQKPYDVRFRNVNDMEFAAYQVEPLLTTELPEDTDKEDVKDNVNTSGIETDSKKVGLNEELKTDKLKGGDLSGTKYTKSAKTKTANNEVEVVVPVEPESLILREANSSSYLDVSKLGQNLAVKNATTKRTWQELEDGVETGVTRNSHKRSESEESEHGDVCYLSVQYKVEQTFYYYKALRISDFVRFQESRTTQLDLYKFVWERAKDMFEYSSLEKKARAERKEEFNEIFDVAYELFRVAYGKIELDLTGSKPFKLNRGHNADHVEVRVTKKGSDLMKADIKKDGGKSYYFREDVYTANEGLNIGLVALHKSVENMFSVGDKELTLYDCLDAFRTAEKLGKDDEWYCKKCSKHVQATKKMDVYRTGDILVIGLKRFKGERFRREKLCHPVDFPLTGLDLSGYIQDNSESNVFDLFGVSCHMGGMGGGHYIAKVKNLYSKEVNSSVELEEEQNSRIMQSENSTKSKRSTKRKETKSAATALTEKKEVDNNDVWYEISDSSVRRCSESSVVSESAYVLYYQRRKQLNKSTTGEAEKSRQEVEDTTEVNVKMKVLSL